MRRRSSGVLLLVLGLLGAALPMPFATDPAGAVVGTVIPADAGGDPIDELRADDALFAYVTADLLGGKVCVVPGAITNPDDASCKRPAWGDASDVSGLGLGFLPIEKPILQVGTWRLLGHGDEGGRVLTQPFTVLPCEFECHPEIAKATLAGWKAGARKSADALAYGCGNYSLGVLDAAIAIKDGVDAVVAARTALVDQLGKIRRTTRLTTVAPLLKPQATSVLAFAGGRLLPIPLAVMQGNEERAKAILKLLTCNLQLMYEDIVADPPDPAYREVVPATIVDQPDTPGLSPTAVALIDALNRQDAFALAQLHAVERYQGAVADQEEAFIHAQAAAIAANGFALVQAQWETVDLLRQAADEAAAIPLFAGPTVPDQSTLDGFISLYERVRTAGFTAEELTGFTAAGFTADEITQLRAAFDVDLSVLDAGLPFPDALRKVADELESAIPAFDRLAREAEGVAMSINPAPDAGFECLQVEPRRIRCETKSVAVDLDQWTYDWVVAGASVGTTQVIEHTFLPGAADFTVALTVSDRYRSTTSVTDLGGLVDCCDPVAAFSIRPRRVVAGVPFELLDRSTDDGAVASWRWSISGLPESSEQNPTFRIDDPGRHVVVLDVTDDTGRTAQALMTVWVHPAAGQTTRGPCATTPGGNLDSEGNEFLFAFPDNGEGSTAGPFVSLHITGAVETTGYVEVPGLGHVEDFGVTPGTATVLSLPSSQASGGGVLNNLVDHVVPLGVRVCAAAPVSVYGLNQRVASTDAFQAIPVDALGTDHIVMAYPDTLTNFPYGGSSFTVVAVEDGTTVQVTPTAASEAGPAGVPFELELDRFDVYTVLASEDGTDLTGSRIVSDRSVAVMGGNRCAYVPAGAPACDHLVEQLPPTSTWGDDFVVPSLAVRTSGDIVRVLARDDATVVSADGSEPFRLDAGEHRDLELASGETLQVSATAPILVAQLAKGLNTDNTNGDPFMALAVPTAQFRTGYTLDAVTPSTGFYDSWINVTAPAGASCTDNGAAIGPFEQVAGTGWSVARHHTQLGAHVVDCGGTPFGVLTYGWDHFESYGYPGGFNLGPIAPPPARLETAVGYAGPDAVQYSDVLPLAVGLFEASPGVLDPLPGRLLGVDLDLGSITLGPTGADGIASQPVVVDAAAGPLTIAVDFAGDERYRAATRSETISVGPEDCALQAAASGGVGALVLRADLRELDTSVGDLSGRTIAFVVDGAAPVTAVTDASGRAVAQVAAAPGSHAVQVRFAGDDHYAPCDAPPFVAAARGETPPPSEGPGGPPTSPPSGPPGDEVLGETVERPPAAARGTASACPPGQPPPRRFPDVSDADAHRPAIDCLAWWGITQGRIRTLDGRQVVGYAPIDSISRGQAASMMARLIRATGGVLPTAVPNVFDDDDASVHRTAIDALAAVGVIRGSDGRFRPDVNISREEMASVLARTFRYLDGAALPAPGDYFADDGGSKHEAAINMLAGVGVIEGVGEARFAPHDPLLRNQAASIIVRLLDLLIERGRSVPPPRLGD